MNNDHLEKRVNPYENSIKTVVQKRILWKIKILMVRILKSAEQTYNMGWRVQELNRTHTNEAVNITFDSFPRDLIGQTNKIPTYQFLQGGSLVFSQMYNGDIEILVSFPALENSATFDNDLVELGIYDPHEINEK